MDNVKDFLEFLWQNIVSDPSMWPIVAAIAFCIFLGIKGFCSLVFKSKDKEKNTKENNDI